MSVIGLPPNRAPCREPIRSAWQSVWHSELLRRTTTPLAFLQLASLAAFAVSIVFLAILIRHRTDDYFMPVADYLMSIKVALPPAAIFVTTYVVAFISGTPVSEVPKTVLSIARNKFFQSRGVMIATCVASMILALISTSVVTITTPPAYRHLVHLLLRGSSDNLQLAREKVDGIRKINPNLAAQYGKVVEVFAERNAINAGAKPLSGERVRTFVRSLEAETGDMHWNNHPLRQHGLAEAYLLFGQSFDQAGAVVDNSISTERRPYERAIELYESVIASNSPLAPAMLKLSAKHNIGNSHYYRGHYDAAIKKWRAVMSEGEGNESLSSWGNMVAAFVGLDKPEAAVQEGEKAKQWAERNGRAFIDTYQFAGVLESTAFARLKLRQYALALRDFTTAHAFREDDLTRQNLALGLIVVGRHSDAQKVLRQIAPPIYVGDLPKFNVATCVYLIWGLALVDAPLPERAANFATFLGDKLSATELNAFDMNRMTDLRKRVLTALPKTASPCNSLSLFEAITARVLRD